MKKPTVLWAGLAVIAWVWAAAGFTITLNQNYTGAPGNMIVQTDAYGCLTGDRNAPLVLPSPTRSGYDFRGWFTTPAATGGTRVLSGANGTKFTENTTIYARWTTKTTRTINDIPALEKEHFDWVKDFRNVCEACITGSGGSAGNLTFHQIFAGKGSINWAIRWESNDTVSLQERRRIAAMLYDGINEWLRPLMGYEDWPFGEIPVSVVGWAVQSADLIRDRQPNETIWVNSTIASPNSGYSTGFMTSAPNARSRFINYNTINNTSGGYVNYRWPDSIGGINGRFDKYLWLTKNKEGGNGSAEGGDWGFRWGQQGTGNAGSGTSAANSHATNGTIHGTMIHEIGHSFGFYDWYGNATADCAAAGVPRRPPTYGNSSRTMMQTTYNTNTSGNPTLNQYDQWQIRYYWNWVKSTSPANRWNYTTVAWEPSVPTSVTPIAAAHSAKQPQFRFDNRGTLRYDLGGAQTADLKIFDSRGRLVRAMRLSGAQTTANINLNVANQMLIWSIEAQGRVIDQGRTQFVSR